MNELKNKQSTNENLLFDNFNKSNVNTEQNNILNLDSGNANIKEDVKITNSDNNVGNLVNENTIHNSKNPNFYMDFNTGTESSEIPQSKKLDKENNNVSSRFKFIYLNLI